MKIFKTFDIKQIDKYTIENEPVSSIDLMKRAAYEFYIQFVADIYVVTSNHSHINSTIKIFAGIGNNGGDALFVAQYLLKNCDNVEVYFCNEGNNISDDCRQARDLLQQDFPDKLIEINNVGDFPRLSSEDYIIDGLFGSGLNRPLTGFYAEIVKLINKANATVFAIDIPSGLMGENNENNIPEHIVCADYTFTFQFPKLSFLFPENEKYVGEWEVLDIGLHPDAIENTATNFFMTDEDFVNQHLKKRRKFSHKGTYGHALLIGGSYGKMGAAVLASKACLRSGVGLLTTHVPKCGYEIMQISVPEAMVSVDNSEEYFSAITNDISIYSTIGIGIGLGKHPQTVDALKSLLEKMSSPAVFDADALNIIAENNYLLKYVPKNSIFTPHPKEYERLAGKAKNDYEKIESIITFAAHHQVYVVLKGAYTAIACPDGTCWFNSTGNPGMATAGSGDVLCGIILGLLAQQYSPFEAAVLGAYLHGKAGDKAARKHSQAGMIAGDIIEGLRITTD